MVTVGSLIAVVGARVEGFVRGLRQAEGASKSFEVQINARWARIQKRFERVARSIRQVVGRFINLRTILGTLAGGGVFGALIGNTTRYVDQLAKQSRALRVNIEDMQVFTRIANLTGATTQATFRAFRQFTKNVGEARFGRGTFSDYVGEFLRLRGATEQYYDLINAPNNAEAFRRLIGFLNNVSNETERNALSNAIFGRAWIELQGAIDLGTDGLTRFEEQLRANNALVSESTGRKFEVLADEFFLLFETIKSGFAIALDDTGILDALIEKVNDLGKYAGRVIPEIVRSFNDVNSELGRSVEALKRVGEAFVSAFKYAVNNSQVILSIITALGTLKFLGLNPLGLISATLIGLATYDSLTDDSVRRNVNDTIRSLRALERQGELTNKQIRELNELEAEYRQQNKRERQGGRSVRDSEFQQESLTRFDRLLSDVNKEALIRQTSDPLAPQNSPVLQNPTSFANQSQFTSAELAQFDGQTRELEAIQERQRTINELLRELSNESGNPAFAEFAQELLDEGNALYNRALDIEIAARRALAERSFANLDDAGNPAQDGVLLGLINNKITPAREASGVLNQSANNSAENAEVRASLARISENIEKQVDLAREFRQDINSDAETQFSQSELSEAFRTLFPPELIGRTAADLQALYDELQATSLARLQQSRDETDEELRKRFIEESILYSKGAKEVNDIIESGNEDRRNIEERYNEQRRSKLIELAEEFSSAFDGITDTLLNFVKTGKLAFDDLLTSILDSIFQTIVNKTITDPIGNFFGTAIAGAVGGIVPGGGGSGVPRAPIPRASGGFVYGEGTGTSDSILARLSNGEFVVREAVAKRFGGVLSHLNQFGSLPAYNAGGFVGGGSLGGNRGVGSPVTINIENRAGVEVSATERQGDGFERVIEIAVNRARAAVGEDLLNGRGAVGRANRQRNGT